MDKFKVLSGISVGNIVFDSDKTALLNAIGTPKTDLNRRGINSMVYDSCVVLLENEKVVEVSFKDFSHIELMGIDFESMTHKETLNALYALDKNVYESLGFFVFTDLCVSLTGFEDQSGDTSDKAINFFVKGRWDSQLDQMTKRYGF